MRTQRHDAGPSPLVPRGFPDLVVRLQLGELLQDAARHACRRRFVTSEVFHRHVTDPAAANVSRGGVSVFPPLSRFNLGLQGLGGERLRATSHRQGKPVPHDATGPNERLGLRAAAVLYIRGVVEKLRWSGGSVPIAGRLRSALPATAFPESPRRRRRWAREFGAREWERKGNPIPLPEIRLPSSFETAAPLPSALLAALVIAAASAVR